MGCVKVLKHVYIEEGEEGTKSLKIGRAQLMKFILLFLFWKARKQLRREQSHVGVPGSSLEESVWIKCNFWN